MTPGFGERATIQRTTQRTPLTNLVDAARPDVWARYRMVQLARRVIDFSSGLAYAVAASMQRVADQVFLLTPTNVEVSQEEKDRLQARGLYQA